MKKVLIIDDEKGFCSVVKMDLQLTQKFDVEIAYNGIEGIDKAKNFKPDVILLDLMMPDMNGFEVLKILKEDKGTKYIPIIMLTAVGEAEAKAKAGDMCSDCYVTKPVKSKDLVSKIEMILNTPNS